MGLVDSLSTVAREASARERLGHLVGNVVTQLTEGTTTLEGKATFNQEIFRLASKLAELKTNLEIVRSGTWSGDIKADVLDIGSRAIDTTKKRLAEITQENPARLNRIALVLSLLKEAEKEGIPFSILERVLQKEVEKRGLEWKGETDTSSN